MQRSCKMSCSREARLRPSMAFRSSYLASRSSSSTSAAGSRALPLRRCVDARPTSRSLARASSARRARAASSRAISASTCECAASRTFSWRSRSLLAAAEARFFATRRASSFSLTILLSRFSAVLTSFSWPLQKSASVVSAANFSLAAIKWRRSSPATMSKSLSPTGLRTPPPCCWTSSASAGAAAATTIAATPSHLGRPIARPSGTTGAQGRLHTRARAPSGNSNNNGAGRASTARATLSP
mmetsp:Transcript_121312/g.337952  ORF Transcript_121312/g.337952 Transcript_121312/m.337952 type:complete len:242 (-) Transcript_121312:523-1248(-)